MSLLGEQFTPDEIGRLERMRLDRRALSENGISVLRESAALLREEAARQNEDGQQPSAVSAVERRRAALAAAKNGQKSK